GAARRPGQRPEPRPPCRGPPLPRHAFVRYLPSSPALRTRLGTGDPLGADKNWLLYGRKAVLDVEHARVPAFPSSRIVGQVTVGFDDLLSFTNQRLGGTCAAQR